MSEGKNWNTSGDLREVYLEHTSVTKLTVRYGDLEYLVVMQTPEGPVMERFDAMQDPMIGIHPMDMRRITDIARTNGHNLYETDKLMALAIG